MGNLVFLGAAVHDIQEEMGIYIPISLKEEAIKNFCVGSADITKGAGPLDPLSLPYMKEETIPAFREWALSKVNS